MKKFASIGALLLGIALTTLPGINSASALIDHTTATRQPDSLIAKEISKILAGERAGSLNFPETVRRLYRQAASQPLWTGPQNGEGQTWQAMLLLDCVIQYGLSGKDYHPAELTYKRVHDILDTPGKVNISEQARFDILLSDALLTLMNHMHYGKLNPKFTTKILDESGSADFRTDKALLLALNEKKGYDFLTAIESAQPSGISYQNMQRHMRLLAGLYTGDNYEVPDSVIKLMAINMERLRWSSQKVDSNYIEVNIPAYTLQFFQRDTTYSFKIAVGTPSQPTPTLSSTITYLTTAPDVPVPAKRFRDELLPAALKDVTYLKKNHFAIYDKKGKYIVVDDEGLKKIAQRPGDFIARHASGHDRALGRLVFRFSNAYQIDLHDMPKTDFFESEERALTTGCIWLSGAEKLGRLVLKNDGQTKEMVELSKAFKKYQRKIFVLKRPITINLNYLTCEVSEGALITYPDIYQLDPGLEQLLYPEERKLAMR